MPKDGAGDATPRTAATFEQRLKQAGRLDAFLEMRRQKDEELARRRAELKLAEAPLVAALRAAGVNVVSVWDLVNTRVRYPRAVPVLLEHLSKEYPDPIREGIARALATRDARPAWDALVAQYRVETMRQTKDGLAVALGALADDGVLHTVIELATDRSLGPSRVLLIGPLARTRDPRGKETLELLTQDPQTAPQATIFLKRIAKRKR